jgi:hypothetical protein
VGGHELSCQRLSCGRGGAAGLVSAPRWGAMTSPYDCRSALQPPTAIDIGVEVEEAVVVSVPVGSSAARPGWRTLTAHQALGEAKTGGVRTQYERVPQVLKGAELVAAVLEECAAARMRAAGSELSVCVCAQRSTAGHAAR